MFDSIAIGVMVCLWDKVGYAINDDQAHATHTTPMFTQLRSVLKVWTFMLHICVENHNQYNLASQGGLPRLRKRHWNFLLWACQDALSKKL